MRTYKRILLPIGLDQKDQTVCMDFRHDQHAFAYSKSHIYLDQFVRSLLCALHTEFSKEEIRLCLVDFSDSKEEKFSEFIQDRYEESNLDLFCDFCMWEIREQQRILSANGGVPEIFVIINRLDLLKNEEKMGKLIKTVQCSRAVGIHFIATSMDGNRRERFAFGKNYDVDQIKQFYMDDFQTTLWKNKIEGLSIKKYSWEVISDTGEKKVLQLVHGNLCKLQSKCDLVVCSAFKNSYAPTPNSMIGALYREKGIDVSHLAERPELDFKEMGGWISYYANRDFKRIACLELLDYEKRYSEMQQADIILKKAFSTLCFMLEKATEMGIPIRTIALPILGGGYQKIEISFILSTLASKCEEILKFNPGVQSITFYEQDLEKFEYSVQMLKNIFEKKEVFPDVFLSYSSKQSEMAEKMCSFLRKNGIRCWMASDSIPAGSSYMEEIPMALSKVKMVVLLLTPDAEKSRWVRKEVGTAIGADKILLPYQPVNYSVGREFRFVLDGEQILDGSGEEEGEEYPLLLRSVKEALTWRRYERV